MTKVSFEVDMELWYDYMVFAVSHGKTAAEMLNQNVAETVRKNKYRIARFKKGMQNLIKSLDEEEQK